MKVDAHMIDSLHQRSPLALQDQAFPSSQFNSTTNNNNNNVNPFSVDTDKKTMTLRHSSNAVQIHGNTPVNASSSKPPKKTNRKTYTSLPTVLGKGAKSVVRRGYCTETLERVAIKILDKKLLTPKNYEQLKNEIYVLQSLQKMSAGSNKFIKLYDVEENESQIKLIMEHASGSELFNFCVQFASGVPDHIAKPIFKQICQSVAQMHSYGFAHLDLKLENIMYDTKTEKVTLIDFGFARPTSRMDIYTGEQVPIRHTVFCGSIHYAAPELVLQRPYDGKKADVWSLGILLFAVLNGRFPFDDTSDRKDLIFKKITHQTLRMPSHLTSGANSLLRAMLARDPNQRPSMEEVLAHPWFQDLSDQQA